MKIRTGFVSNSSSSSFCLDIKNLPRWKVEAIKDHINFSKEYLKEDVSCSDGWYIEEHRNHLSCRTEMDNFDLEHFIVDVLRIPEEKIYNFYGD